MLDKGSLDNGGLRGLPEKSLKHACRAKGDPSGDGALMLS